VAERPVIAHVLHRLYLAGAEVLAADLSRRLRDRYTFAFLCLDEIGPLGRQLQAEGFEVIDLQRRPGIDWSVARRLRSHARRLRVDVLHAHQYTPFFYAAVSRGLLGTLRSSPRILFTEHGRHYPDYPRRKRMLINPILLRGGDRVTAVGHFVKQALVNHEGLPDARIAVIHNGIDADRFHYDAEESPRLHAEVRAELGLAPDAAVALQVARFHPVKDHATAIAAFAHVVRELPQAVLLLAGDGDERPRLEQRIAELNLQGHVRLLGVRQDVPRLMAAADVFLLSSLSEGISVTLLEAMGCQLPIATTAVGGNGEVVADGETGLLSPRGDAGALGANLTRLLRDADLRRRFGAAGRQRLERMFTQQQMHSSYADLYATMTAR
jgi:glycosyltransferase involved in cell wall biosynthesis